MPVNRVSAVITPSWQRRILLNPPDSDQDEFSSSSDEDDTSTNSTVFKPTEVKFLPRIIDSLKNSKSQNSSRHTANEKSPVSHWIGFQSRNFFFNAIKTAATQYSSRLRTCSLKSTPTVPNPTTKASRGPLLLDQSVDSQDNDDSSDEEKVNEIDASSTVLSPEQITQLLYKPVGDWAAYSNKPIENPKVIARLHAGSMCEAFIKEGDIGGRHITYISKTWVLSQKWEGFFSELAFYASPNYLRPLQGDVIPTIIGVYLIDGRISVAMELPHSSFWTEASPDMPDAFKEKCIEAFEKIHSRGVLHNDVELRHMLIDAEGNPVIIDFQLSQALTPQPELGITACTESDIRLEKRKVLYKLDFEKARKKENEKRRRVIGKQKRNAIRRRQYQLKRIGQWDKPISDFEKDDPDDVLNPIVEPQVWMDCWVDEFLPSCYIVPGQPALDVDNALCDFVRKWGLVDPQFGVYSFSSSSVVAPARSRSRKRKRVAASLTMENDVDDEQEESSLSRKRCKDGSPQGSMVSKANAVQHQIEEVGVNKQTLATHKDLAEAERSTDVFEQANHGPICNSNLGLSNDKHDSEATSVSQVDELGPKTSQSSQGNSAKISIMPSGGSCATSSILKRPREEQNHSNGNKSKRTKHVTIVTGDIAKVDAVTVSAQCSAVGELDTPSADDGQLSMSQDYISQHARQIQNGARLQAATSVVPTADHHNAATPLPHLSIPLQTASSSDTQPMQVIQSPDNDNSGFAGTRDRSNKSKSLNNILSDVRSTFDEGGVMEAQVNIKGCRAKVSAGSSVLPVFDWVRKWFRN